MKQISEEEIISRYPNEDDGIEECKLLDDCRCAELEAEKKELQMECAKAGIGKYKVDYFIGKLTTAGELGFKVKELEKQNKELVGLLKNAVKDLKRHDNPKLNPWMKKIEQQIRMHAELKEQHKLIKRFLDKEVG